MTTWPDLPGVVEFPDGRRVRGAGIRQDRDGVTPADFAIYLLGSDPHVTMWPSRWVQWRDFWIPSSTDDAVAAIAEAHERALHERVEVSCGGGTGRTGCAMAVLAAMSGVARPEVIEWVRANYRKRAVETPWQRRWVHTAVARLHAEI